MAEKGNTTGGSKAQKSKSEKAPAKKEEQKKEEKQVPVTKSNGSNGTSESSENGNGQPATQTERRAPPSEADLERYRKYVGNKWKGKCRWFNVSKGFGFIDPYFEEAREHNDDVFVHQSALVMEGFRSLDEDEEVEFTVSLGRNGLEASEVRGVNGAALRGHHVRPLGKKREKMIRCFKCGQLGFHRAQHCKKEISAKACYHCHSADHLVGNCPDFQAQRQARGENRGPRREQRPRKDS
ncbi:Protein lin-28-like protein isoform X2 [Aphelenchoides besseyi]|nr:Protein lin-28-like protein isoform X2 [Aphelenchoides besseyi]